MHEKGDLKGQRGGLQSTDGGGWPVIGGVGGCTSLVVTQGKKVREREGAHRLGWVYRFCGREYLLRVKGLVEHLKKGDEIGSGHSWRKGSQADERREVSVEEDRAEGPASSLGASEDGATHHCPPTQHHFCLFSLPCVITFIPQDLLLCGHRCLLCSILPVSLLMSLLFLSASYTVQRRVPVP